MFLGNGFVIYIILSLSLWKSIVVLGWFLFDRTVAYIIWCFCVVFVSDGRLVRGDVYMVGVFESGGFQQPTSVVPDCPSRIHPSMIPPPQREFRARHGFSRVNVNLVQNLSYFHFLMYFK